jgi:hypothetical protein
MQRPDVDGRAPADAISEMVEDVLSLAATWTSWDGEIIRRDPRGYTPHKAIRRVADHLVDHLAQFEAHTAGVQSLPDLWHGSDVTTPADLAPFTSDDLDEARSRLERLAQIWRIRLDSYPAEKLDVADGDAYTPREMAFCAAVSRHYAESVGDLSGCSAAG